LSTKQKSVSRNNAINDTASTGTSIMYPSCHAKTAPNRNGIRVVENFGKPDSSTQPANVFRVIFFCVMNLCGIQE